MSEVAPAQHNAVASVAAVLLVLGSAAVLRAPEVVAVFASLSAFGATAVLLGWIRRSALGILARRAPQDTSASRYAAKIELGLALVLALTSARVLQVRHATSTLGG